jgi:hypothetical protein
VARRRPVLSTGARTNRRGPVVGEETRQHIMRDRLREVPHQQRGPRGGSGPRLLLRWRRGWCGGGSQRRRRERRRRREGRHQWLRDGFGVGLPGAEPLFSRSNASTSSHARTPQDLIFQAPVGESRTTERGSAGGGGAAGRTGGVEAPCCGRTEEGGGATSSVRLVWWATIMMHLLEAQLLNSGLHLLEAPN